MDSWIALNDYANKYQVSISTLRRRIKANKIRYKLEDGKYLLNESDISPVRSQGAEAYPSTERVDVSLKSHREDEYSLTQLLMEELKKAYLDSLQSKEDQILYLKQQVADLKTLVMYLEKENQRTKTKGI